MPRLQGVGVLAKAADGSSDEQVMLLCVSVGATRHAELKREILPLLRHRRHNHHKGSSTHCNQIKLSPELSLVGICTPQLGETSPSISLQQHAYVMPVLERCSAVIRAACQSDAPSRAKFAKYAAAVYMGLVRVVVFGLEDGTATALEVRAQLKHSTRKPFLAVSTSTVPGRRRPSVARLVSQELAEQVQQQAVPHVVVQKKPPPLQEQDGEDDLYELVDQFSDEFLPPSRPSRRRLSSSVEQQPVEVEVEEEAPPDSPPPGADSPPPPVLFATPETPPDTPPGSDDEDDDDEEEEAVEEYVEEDEDAPIESPQLPDAAAAPVKQSRSSTVSFAPDTADTSTLADDDDEDDDEAAAAAASKRRRSSSNSYRYGYPSLDNTDDTMSTLQRHAFSTQSLTDSEDDEDNKPAVAAAATRRLDVDDDDDQSYLSSDEDDEGFKRGFSSQSVLQLLTPPKLFPPTRIRLHVQEECHLRLSNKAALLSPPVFHVRLLAERENNLDLYSEMDFSLHNGSGEEDGLLLLNQPKQTSFDAPQVRTVVPPNVPVFEFIHVETVTTTTTSGGGTALPVMIKVACAVKFVKREDEEEDQQEEEKERWSAHMVCRVAGNPNFSEDGVMAHFTQFRLEVELGAHFQGIDSVRLPPDQGGAFDFASGVVAWDYGDLKLGVTHIFQTRFTCLRPRAAGTAASTQHLASLVSFSTTTTSSQAFSSLRVAVDNAHRLSVSSTLVTTHFVVRCEA